MAILDILATINDPEVPVLSILDLGIVREVNEQEDELEIVITPTYTGCPAMNFIEVNIKATLQQAGYKNIKVKQVLSPPWTTDWMSEEGRKKLLAYGIAPPVAGTIDKDALFAEAKAVPCPQCKSEHTEMVSQFGSTACKAMYKCLDCKEPFDYFKCH